MHIFGVICHLKKQILIWVPLYFLKKSVCRFTFKVVQTQCLANFKSQKIEVQWISDSWNYQKLDFWHFWKAKIIILISEKYYGDKVRSKLQLWNCQQLIFETVFFRFRPLYNIKYIYVSTYMVFHLKNVWN